MKKKLINRFLMLTLGVGVIFQSCTDAFDPSYLEKELDDLNSRVDNVESRLDAIESAIKGMNTSIGTLEKLVQALESKLYVASITPSDNGLIILFSDGSKSQITISQEPALTPVISVEEVEGVYYWTVNGEFLLDKNGDKIRVTGKDASAPVIGVKNSDGILYWTVDGEFLLDGNGDKIPATANGNSNIKAPVIGVKESDGKLYWTVDGEYLLDGNGNKIPVTGENGSNGSDGSDGQDGKTPVIGAKLFEGKLYWTVNGEFLLDDNGNKIPMTGENGSDGSDGSDGQDGKTPVIGAKLFEGKLYWTVNGEFLLDDNGNKIPMTGENGSDGSDGSDGQDGKASVIGVKEFEGKLYWTVDGEFLLDDNGNKVLASYAGDGDSNVADSVFKDARIENGNLVLTLQDGSVFSISMSSNSDIYISESRVHFETAEVKNIHVGLTGIKGVSVSEKPEGWRASISGTTLTVKAPSKVNEDVDVEGFVKILATSGDKTFISQVYVSLNSPSFKMDVQATGSMKLTPLDYDFNSPGFVAGFVKASDYSPENAIQPIIDGGKNYEFTTISTEDGEEYFSTSITNYLTPVAGELYVAYCIPGYLSRKNDYIPSVSDVYAQYFTYIEPQFEISSVTSSKATLKISFNGVSSFYGGILRYYDESKLPSLRQTFLNDAQYPLKNNIDGIYGLMMTGFKGNIAKFAAYDNGNGKREDRLIVPGAKYAIALIPKYDGRSYEEYTVDDVIIRTVELEQPKEASSSLVRYLGYTNTPTSVTASFYLTDDTYRFYYSVVEKTVLEESGLSMYDYVSDPQLRSASIATWDRKAAEWDGPVESMQRTLTNLKPNVECVAIGLAFNSTGDYQLVSAEISSDSLKTSQGSVSIASINQETYSERSRKITISFDASPEIKVIRTKRLSIDDYNYIYGADDSRIYNDLTLGSRSFYDDDITLSSEKSVEFYVSPGYEFIYFIVGMEDESTFTGLVKQQYKAE